MKNELSTKNCDRFSSPEVASKYASAFRPRHFRDWREKKAILRGLNYIPKRAHVLDLPCGTGRLTRLLAKEGFDVTCADRSIDMLNLAETHLKSGEPGYGFHHPHMKYSREDLVLGTRFGDKAFDAVVCHRLFHHLVDPDTRILAIKELKRITKGPIVLSFFDSFSLSAVVRLVKNRIMRRHPTDRIPISKKTIVTELESQGIEVTKFIPALWGISPLCLIVAQSIDKKRAMVSTGRPKTVPFSPRSTAFGSR